MQNSAMGVPSKQNEMIIQSANVKISHFFNSNNCCSGYQYCSRSVEKKLSFTGVKALKPEQHCALKAFS